MENENYRDYNSIRRSTNRVVKYVISDTNKQSNRITTLSNSSFFPPTPKRLPECDETCAVLIFTISAMF